MIKMKRANLLKLIFPFEKMIIAVGTPVTRRPPHRSQRAELPHWAPALGKDAQALAPPAVSVPAHVADLPGPVSGT